MKYRIEFSDASNDNWTKEIQAGSDNEAEEACNKFKEEISINPAFKVLGLVRVEVKEVLIRILPRKDT